MLGNISTATFFLGSGIAQLFWVIPIIKRWVVVNWLKPKPWPPPVKLLHA